MMIEQDLLVRAERGETDVIAFILNLTFNKQNQSVNVQARDEQLEISIAASVLPPQKSTTRWIANAVMQLNVSRVKTIVVCAKLPRLAAERLEMNDVFSGWQHSIHFFPNSSQIDPFSSSIDIRQSEPPVDLTEYCFIRNKFLLKGTLAMPSEPTTQLVLSFAALNNADKLKVIPYLYDFLFQIEDTKDSPLSTIAQDWFDRATIASVVLVRTLSLAKPTLWPQLTRLAIDECIRRLL